MIGLSPTEAVHAGDAATRRASRRRNARSIRTRKIKSSLQSAQLCAREGRSRLRGGRRRRAPSPPCRPMRRSTDCPPLVDPLRDRPEPNVGLHAATCATHLGRTDQMALHRPSAALSGEEVNCSSRRRLSAAAINDAGTRRRRHAEARHLHHEQWRTDRRQLAASCTARMSASILTGALGLPRSSSGPPARSRSPRRRRATWPACCSSRIATCCSSSRTASPATTRATSSARSISRTTR